MTDRYIESSRDGPVGVVRMIHEKSRNSLSNEMRVAISGALAEVAADTDVRVLYLTGAGPAFCSGGDLKNLNTMKGSWQVHQRFRKLGAWVLPLMRLDKPVVVGVNGVAAGGGLGLALAGDIVIAAESAKFMAAFFRLGVLPDVCMMYTLPRLIGMAKAKKFLFGNETWTAREALDHGLIAQVVPDADLEAACLARCHDIANGPAEVMGLARLVMARSFESSLDEMFLYEGLGQALSMTGPEFREGLDALLEKRKPDFPGKARGAR